MAAARASCGKLCGGDDYVSTSRAATRNVSSDACVAARGAECPRQALRVRTRSSRWSATREQQQNIVFALIMYLNGACYLEDGHIRRMFEATLALGTERAIREATERMEVLRATVGPTVAPSLLPCSVESHSLEKVKRVVEDKATEPPRLPCIRDLVVERPRGRSAPLRRS